MSTAVTPRPITAASRADERADDVAEVCVILGITGV